MWQNCSKWVPNSTKICVDSSTCSSRSSRWTKMKFLLLSLASPKTYSKPKMRWSRRTRSEFSPKLWTNSMCKVWTSSSSRLCWVKVITRSALLSFQWSISIGRAVNLRRWSRSRSLNCRRNSFRPKMGSCSIRLYSYCLNSRRTIRCPAWNCFSSWLRVRYLRQSPNANW